MEMKQRNYRFSPAFFAPWRLLGKARGVSVPARARSMRIPHYTDVRSELA